MKALPLAKQLRLIGLLRSRKTDGERGPISEIGRDGVVRLEGRLDLQEETENSIVCLRA